MSSLSDLKTQPTKASVAAYLNAIEDPDRRRDAKKLAKWMREATGCRAKLWGTRIVGFDQYHYKYASGREGDWPIVGFAVSKRETSIYIMPGFGDYQALLKRLGKHRIGKSCLYVKNLDDLDADLLQEMIRTSVATMRKRYPR